MLAGARCARNCISACRSAGSTAAAVRAGTAEAVRTCITASSSRRSLPWNSFDQVVVRGAVQRREDLGLLRVSMPKPSRKACWARRTSFRPSSASRSSRPARCRLCASFSTGRRAGSMPAPRQKACRALRTSASRYCAPRGAPARRRAAGRGVPAPTARRGFAARPDCAGMAPGRDLGGISASMFSDAPRSSAPCPRRAAATTLSTAHLRQRAGARRRAGLRRRRC